MKNKNAVSAKVAATLRKIVKHILAMPTRYDQNEVLVKVVPGKPFIYSGPNLSDSFKTPACGTIGCLAGWITFLDLGPMKAMNVSSVDYATKKLKLSPEQARSLFGGYHSWPEEFVDAYDDAKTPRAIAKVAQRRVEHFIKTGE